MKKWLGTFTQRAVRLDEDVLHEIAGVLVVTHEPIAQQVDLPPVPFDDHVKRMAATCAQTRTSARSSSLIQRGVHLARYSS